MSSQDRLDILVVIVTYNPDEALLNACLDSVTREIRNLKLRSEVVIFDNASDRKPTVALSDDSVVLLESPDNIGFGRAVNEALSSREDSSLVLLLNPDAQFSPGALGDLLRELAMLSPGDLIVPVLRAHGNVQVDALIDWTFSGERYVRRALMSRRLRTATRTGAARLPVQKACGGALLGHRDLFRKMGPFDASFFLYGEDADLSRRLRRVGNQIWCCPSVEVIHHAASSQRNHGPLVEMARTDAAIRLAAKHHGRTVAMLQRAELLGVTIAGLLLQPGSSATRRNRLFRLRILWRWKFKTWLPAFKPNEAI